MRIDRWEPALFQRRDSTFYCLLQCYGQCDAHAPLKWVQWGHAFRRGFRHPFWSVVVEIPFFARMSDVLKLRSWERRHSRRRRRPRAAAANFSDTRDAAHAPLRRRAGDRARGGHCGLGGRQRQRQQRRRHPRCSASSSLPTHSAYQWQPDARRRKIRSTIAEATQGTFCDFRYTVNSVSNFFLNSCTCAHSVRFRKPLCGPSRSKEKCAQCMVAPD